MDGWLMLIIVLIFLLVVGAESRSHLSHNTLFPPSVLVHEQYGGQMKIDAAPANIYNILFGREKKLA